MVFLLLFKFLTLENSWKVATHPPRRALVRFFPLDGRHAQVILQAAGGGCVTFTHWWKTTKTTYLVTSCTMDELSGSPWYLMDNVPTTHQSTPPHTHVT